MDDTQDRKIENDKETRQSGELRKIIHVDMDAFFAAVEQRDHPELRGRPIAVGGGEERGGVATASYEARRYGVRSAMSGVMARRLCPELIFVHGRMNVYKEVSAQVHEVFHRYTDIIEPISLDEAFLDVTVNKPGIELAVEIARRIKREIREETGLVASAGVSYNKFLAKIASDWRKPDGLCTIHPDRAADFVAELPIERFWGVGPVTAKKMHSLGIHTGADLRRMPLQLLELTFGKAGRIYYDFARGIDNRPVEPVRVRKSVGCEHTIDHDIFTDAEIEQHLTQSAAELAARIARKEFHGVTLTLKVKFYDFTLISRSITSAAPYTDEARILADARKLMAGVEYDVNPVRLVGLSVSNRLSDELEVWRQLELDFGSQSPKA